MNNVIDWFTHNVETENKKTKQNKLTWKIYAWWIRMKWKLIWVQTIFFCNASGCYPQRTLLGESVGSLLILYEYVGNLSIFIQF